MSPRTHYILQVESGIHYCRPRRGERIKVVLLLADRTFGVAETIQTARSAVRHGGVSGIHFFVQVEVSLLKLLCSGKTKMPLQDFSLNRCWQQSNLGGQYLFRLTKEHFGLIFLF